MSYAFTSYAKRSLIFQDILAFALIYFIPTLSHWLAFPLYLFEPMRIVLLMAYFVSRNFKNALLLAVTLPLFSMLLSGHPPLFKAVLIASELSLNIVLLNLFLKNAKLNMFISVFLSIILSKLFYYGLKYTFIHLMLIEGRLISTAFHFQIGVSVGISLIALLFAKKFKQNSF